MFVKNFSKQFEYVPAGKEYELCQVRLCMLINIVVY